VSIFLHAINAILIFVLFKNLFKKYWISFLSALVFAIHPLQTQAVVYIAGLGDPLSGFFMLSGTIAYIKSQKDDPKTRVYTLLACLCFICALFSKENAVMMPGLLFLADIFLRQTHISLKENLKLAFKKIMPFVAIFTYYILARLTFLNFLKNVYASSFSTPLYERVLIFFSTISDYFQLIFVPLRLHMEHSVYWVHSFWEPKALIGSIIILFFFGLIISQWKKRPAISFGLAWFLVAYSPNANIFMPTTNLFGEHWLYLSLPGLFLAIFCTGEEFIRKKRYFFAVVFFLSIWIGWMCYATVNRNLEWETPIGILSQTHREEPKKVQVMIVLANLYHDRGEDEKALNLYAEALRLEPNNYLAYNFRAELYKKKGDVTDMIYDMKRSCELSPVYSPSCRPLVKLYIQNKKFDEAERLLNLQLSQADTPKIALGTMIQLVSMAVGKQDHALVKKYLLMSNEYEKELQKNWTSRFQFWLANR
jgi:tetratricopeptide (TPR) repeat protein